MKKVLIINPYFPPFTSIASRRFGDMVKYMEEHGWEPTVVTINSKGSLKVNLKEENIIRVGDFNQSEESHNKAKKIFLISDLKQRMGYLMNLRMVDRFLFTWYKQVINNPDVIKAAKETDIIVASYMPSASFFIAKKLASKFNKKWIADFRDLGALYDEGKDKFPRFVDKQIEKRLLTSASAFTTVSKGLAEELVKVYKKDCHVIYNGWEKDISDNNLTESIEASNLKNKKYIYYAGTIYTHQLDAFKLVIQSLNNNLVLVIRTLGSKENEEALKDFANECNKTEKLLILPPENPEIIKQEADSAFLNLVVEDMYLKNEWKKGVLTGKLFDLMTYKPPILAVAGIKSEIKEVLEETNKGYFGSSVEKISDIIEKVSNEPGALNSDIEKFSKKNQAKKLCAILDEVTK